MKKSKQRKLEKKRRRERQRRSRQTDPLAYHGSKYRTESLVPLHYATELGIFEAYVTSNKQITDHDVTRALEGLILGIRAGTITVSAYSVEGELPAEPEENLIVWRIRENLAEYAEDEPLPDRDQIVGVLRSILGSIETWSNPSPTSRGYLHYLQGFMKDLGTEMQVVSPESASVAENGIADFDAPTDPIAEDQEEDELLNVGRAWVRRSNLDAGVLFRNLADEMIADGHAKEVTEICQQLIGETRKKPIIKKLAEISLRAQQQLLTVAPAANQTTAPHRGLLSWLFGR